MSYQEIMEQLQSLPADIAKAERDVADIKKNVTDLEKTMKMRQCDIVAARESKAWGANDTERKNAQNLAFQNDATMQRLQSAIAGDEYDLSVAEIEVAHLRNTFFAVRSAAELHAAFLLAGRSVGGNALNDLGI